MSPQPTWSAPRGQPLFSGVTLLKESMRFYTDMFASLPFLTFYFEIISSLQKNCESPKDRFLPTHWRVTRPDPCTLTIHKAIHDGVTCESKDRAKRRGTARVRPQAPAQGGLRSRPLPLPASDSPGCDSEKPGSHYSRQPAHGPPSPCRRGPPALDPSPGRCRRCPRPPAPRACQVWLCVMAFGRNYSGRKKRVSGKEEEQEENRNLSVPSAVMTYCVHWVAPRFSMPYAGGWRHTGQKEFPHSYLWRC